MSSDEETFIFQNKNSDSKIWNENYRWIKKRMTREKTMISKRWNFKGDNTWSFQVKICHFIARTKRRLRYLQLSTVFFNFFCLEKYTTVVTCQSMGISNRLKTAKPTRQQKRKWNIWIEKRLVTNNEAWNKRIECL